MNYSSTTIMGNLGQNPEMKYFASGDAVTKFSVAVNWKYGEKEGTDWYNVECYGKTAENVNQYLSKGSGVLVVGTPRSREYEGKTYWTLRANRVVFLDKKENKELAFC